MSWATVEVTDECVALHTLSVMWIVTLTQTHNLQSVVRGNEQRLRRGQSWLVSPLRTVAIYVSAMMMTVMTMTMDVYDRILCVLSFKIFTPCPWSGYFCTPIQLTILLDLRVQAGVPVPWAVCGLGPGLLSCMFLWSLVSYWAVF